MKTGAIRASSSRNGLICFAPSAQLMPTLSSPAWETEFQKASTVWPDSVRPLWSTMVTESMRGTRRAPSSKRRSMACRAALAFKVSKTVSTSSRSTPPSRRPRACS